MKLLRLAVCLAAVFFVGPAAATALIVLNSLDANISVIDRASGKTLKKIPTGKEPHHLMATPDDKSLIIASAGSNDLLFVDPATGEVQRKIKNIADPYQLGFSPDRKWFVVAAYRLNHVDIY
ncbi:MAG: YncE family protein, partial [Burkholderiales bacterium]